MSRLIEVYPENTPTIGKCTQNFTMYYIPLYSSLISLFKQFIYCDSLIKLYLKIAEATFRWMFNHSQLEKGDGLIIGASSVKQLNQNITMCAGAPLSDVIVNEFENLWQKTSHLCPSYKR